jgi:hypothetical protein
MLQQHTLRGVLEFEGVGLHSGARARVTIRPQVAGSGLRFRLAPNGPVIPALAENVVETRRATVIGDGERTVSTKARRSSRKRSITRAWPHKRRRGNSSSSIVRSSTATATRRWSSCRATNSG